MALYFLDTSALVKLYVQEPGTDRLLSLVANQSTDRFVVLSFTRVEARSAIRRRERSGDIEPRAADLVLDDLRAHLETLFITQSVNDAVIDLALQMVDRYALRAYDAIQLAGCLVVGAIEPRGPTFICADRELLKAARSEGCAVLDPIY